MTETQTTFWADADTPIKVGAYAQSIIDRDKVDPPKPEPKPEKRKREKNLRIMAATSLEAWANLTTAQKRGKILDAVKLAGSEGLTCDELSQRWGRPQNELSGRFTELADKKGEYDYGPWIKELKRDGKTVTRDTRTGNAAVVWIAIEVDYSEGVKRG